MNNIATRDKKANKKAAESPNKTTNPLDKGYWDDARWEELEEFVELNKMCYELRLADLDYNRAAYSTWEFIRLVKGWPEWAGLSAGQARKAIMLGYAKIKNDGGNPFDMLPDNDLKEISPEVDFLLAWPKVRMGQIFGRDYLREAVEQAKASPIEWDEELREKLAPMTAAFGLFCNVCVYLQTIIGDGYILLPQERLAELLGVRRATISAYCQLAKNAGLLTEVDGSWSHANRQAKKWRCTQTWFKPEKVTL